MSEYVTVTTIPPCDPCADGTPATFDTRTVFGPWANVCDRHYASWGVGILGTGHGQRLIHVGDDQ